MLTVTGTAEFVFDNGQTMLKIHVAVQPHVPQEHDTLARIAESYVGLTMDHGQLTLDRGFFVLPNDLVKDLEQTPSSAPSDATSASNGLSETQEFLRTSARMNGIKFAGDGSDMGREIEHQVSEEEKEKNLNDLLDKF